MTWLTGAKTFWKRMLGQLPLAAAAGLALAVIAVLRGHGWPGVLAAVGTAGVLAGWELISTVHGPRPPEAYRLRGYRRPPSVPVGPAGRMIVGAILLIMVLLVWWTPGWIAFIGMVLAGVVLMINLALAYRDRRGRPAQRAAMRAAIMNHEPRFVIYTGRRNDASYQLAMWIPVLERLGLPYLVVLRHRDALPSTLAVTGAPVLVLPSGSDLDVIMVPGLSVAFYVNGVGENSTLVNYRNLTHIYLGHGDSDKELSVHPMHSMFDRIFVAGQAAIDRYQKAGVIIPPSKFVMVGRPQLSGLAKAERPIAEIEPPTVLYAPTWRGYNARTTLSSLPVGAAIVRALIDRGAVVSFRVHPFSWLGAGERSEVAAIDEILRQHRDASGRPHRLADENRSASVAENFDTSDALITDIGSVLIDYFATGKPYAVVLPAGHSAATARTDAPSTAAAYLIEYDAVRSGGPGACAGLLDDLLDRDPLADRRPPVARHYLGDHPGDDGPFLDAVRRLIGDPAPAR